MACWQERRGDYLGKTVQVVPHVTDTIMEWIERVAKIPVDGRQGTPDVCIIELGGTVGDIESMPYVEALRQFQFRVGRENILFFHVSLVPVLHPSLQHGSRLGALRWRARPAATPACGMSHTSPVCSRL